MVEKSIEYKIFLTVSLLVIIIGVVLRTYHIFIVGFNAPWGAGGLYLEFARQIFQNNYSIPVTIPHYTYGGLPFAYPPLPFFVESFLVFSLGLPEYLVVNLLPPFVSIISLILFFILSKKVLKNKYAQLLSRVLYAIMPISYMEQVEGAGLAESFGTLFIILLLLVFWLYYQNPYRISSLFLSSLVWGLTVTASPASAYVSVFIFFTLFFMLIGKEKGNLNKMILYILIMGLLAVLISSFYWGTVIKNHGLGLLVNSFMTQHEGSFFILSFIVRLAKMDLIINEPLLSILYIAALFVLLFKKRYELLFLSVFSVLIPRENWIMGIIGILIIGIASDLILKNLPDDFLKRGNQSFSVHITIIAVAGILFLRPLYFVLTRELIREHSLNKTQIRLLENIKVDPSFGENLIILGNNEFLEWAPYITEKSVLNVWFGTELAPSKFWVQDAHKSLIDCENIECINQIISSNFEYDAVSVVIDLNFLDDFKTENFSDVETDTPVKIINDRFIYYSVDEFSD
ncbi:MAG: hypothetical protein ACP5D6_08590 [Kosmotogaceae bacterium]